MCDAVLHVFITYLFWNFAAVVESYVSVESISCVGLVADVTRFPLQSEQELVVNMVKEWPFTVYVSII